MPRRGLFLIVAEVPVGGADVVARELGDPVHDKRRALLRRSHQQDHHLAGP